MYCIYCMYVCMCGFKEFFPLYCAEEISEILNRHNTLHEANKDLMNHASAVSRPDLPFV